MNTYKELLVDLKSLTPREIDLFCHGKMGHKPGQGNRVATWLYRKKIEDIEAMTDLNRSFREQLKQRCKISQLAVEQRRLSEDGTEKLLFRLDDRQTIEGVLIPGPRRLTLCVSTQVGCASGCGFCLTGRGGFVRNLATAEIVNQVFAAQKLSHGQSITNIVLMGTGEPLSNYEAVRKFLEIATGQYGFGYSGKKVTVSTCGLAPMIERLADDDVDASLAVSLNAATDEVRSRIMPVNKTYPVPRLMKSLRYYCDKSGRTVTIEYVLFKGVNDTNEDARRLTDLLGGLPCMVNLLMFNPFPGCSFERPDMERVSVFRDILVNEGYVVVVRESRGKDIQAACGQLRAAFRADLNERRIGLS